MTPNNDHGDLIQLEKIGYRASTMRRQNGQAEEKIRATGTKEILDDLKNDRKQSKLA